MGQTLPELSRPRNTFKSDKDFFQHLSKHSIDLFIHLRTNPNCVNKQDEEGRTILHHTALTGRDLFYSPYIVFAKDLIFNAPGIDFSITDNDGNTPVHLAGFGCHEKETCRTLFPAFIRAAIAHKFDFCTKGYCGFTILHVAARVSYQWDDAHANKNTNFERALKILVEAHIDNLKDVLNSVSTDGWTVLFAPINAGTWDQAKQLIDLGADPALFGVAKYSPLSKLNENRKAVLAEIEDVKKKLRDIEDCQAELRKKVQSLIKQGDGDEKFAKQMENALKQGDGDEKSAKQMENALKEKQNSFVKSHDDLIKLNAELKQIDDLQSSSVSRPGECIII